MSIRLSGVVVALAFCAGIGPASAQEESAADRQYREDYDRVQKITAVSDPARRAEQLLAFVRARPNSKLND